MFNKECFIKRLHDLRKDSDRTQQQLADYLQTTRQQYQKYETGEQELPTRRLVELAELYHVSTDYIVGLTDSRYK